MKTFQNSKGVGFAVSDLAIRADVDEGAKVVSIFILAETAVGNHKAAATNIVMDVREEGQDIAPVMEITQEQAEELMADLWHCGVRPKGIDLSDQVAHKATKAHLEDTRMMMMALWNKLNGQVTTMGPVVRPQQPLKMPDPPAGQSGAEIKNPKGPENEANLSKRNNAGKGQHDKVATSKAKS